MVTCDQARGRLDVEKRTDVGYLLVVSQPEFEEEEKVVSK